MTSETVTAAAVCIVAAILATFLKQYCREHALLCTVAACAGIALAAGAYLSPIAESITKLFERTTLPESYLSVLWKALGICYITTIAGDLCRDCGESALARMAELWGRLSLLFLSLPLLETLLNTMTEVLI